MSGRKRRWPEVIACRAKSAAAEDSASIPSRDRSDCNPNESAENGAVPNMAILPAVTRNAGPAALDLLAQLSGRVTVKLPSHPPANGHYLLQLAVIMEEAGDVASRIREAVRADSEGGRAISPAEARGILIEAEEVAGAVAVLIGMVKAGLEQGKTKARVA